MFLNVLENLTQNKLETHLNNGQKSYCFSPCKNADKTIVFGVNGQIKKNDKVISAASCTTNCLAPVAHVLNQNFKIEKGFYDNDHAFTSDQRILDNSHKILEGLVCKPINCTNFNWCIKSNW